MKQLKSGPISWNEIPQNDDPVVIEDLEKYGIDPISSKWKLVSVPMKYLPDLSLEDYEDDEDDYEYVDNMKERIAEGSLDMPIMCLLKKDGLILLDGYHRTAANNELGKKEIEAFMPYEDTKFKEKESVRQKPGYDQLGLRQPLMEKVKELEQQYPYLKAALTYCSNGYPKSEYFNKVNQLGPEHALSQELWDQTWALAEQILVDEDNLFTSKVDWKKKYNYHITDASKNCGTCSAFKNGKCEMFNNDSVSKEGICSEWSDTWTKNSIRQEPDNKQETLQNEISNLLSDSGGGRQFTRTHTWKFLREKVSEGVSMEEGYQWAKEHIPTYMIVDKITPEMWAEMWQAATLEANWYTFYKGSNIEIWEKTAVRAQPKQNQLPPDWQTQQKIFEKTPYFDRAIDFAIDEWEESAAYEAFCEEFEEQYYGYNPPSMEVWHTAWLAALDSLKFENQLDDQEKRQKDINTLTDKLYYTKVTDYQGSTNWDTWNTSLLIDNKQETYNESRELVDRGGTPEDLRDWALVTIIGPSNNQSLVDAQEWNNIPEHDRLDYNYEAFKNKHQDNQNAMDLLHGLVGGPDVSDYQPDLIDSEIVNWQEIWQKITDEVTDGERERYAKVSDYDPMNSEFQVPVEAIIDRYIKQKKCPMCNEYLQQRGDFLDCPYCPFEYHIKQSVRAPIDEGWDNPYPLTNLMDALINKMRELEDSNPWIRIAYQYDSWPENEAYRILRTNAVYSYEYANPKHPNYVSVPLTEEVWHDAWEKCRFLEELEKEANNLRINKIGGAWDNFYDEMKDTPEWVYHIAPTKERARIKQHGLQPSYPALNPVWKHNDSNKQQKRVIDPDETFPTGLNNQPTGIYTENNISNLRNWKNMWKEPMDTWRIPTKSIQQATIDPYSGGTVIQHPIYDMELHEPYENKTEWPSDELDKPKDWKQEWQWEDAPYLNYNLKPHDLYDLGQPTASTQCQCGSTQCAVIDDNLYCTNCLSPWGYQEKELGSTQPEALREQYTINTISVRRDPGMEQDDMSSYFNYNLTEDPRPLHLLVEQLQEDRKAEGSGYDDNYPDSACLNCEKGFNFSGNPPPWNELICPNCKEPLHDFFDYAYQEPYEPYDPYSDPQWEEPDYGNDQITWADIQRWESRVSVRSEPEKSQISLDPRVNMRHLVDFPDWEEVKYFMSQGTDRDSAYNQVYGDDDIQNKNQWDQTWDAFAEYFMKRREQDQVFNPQKPINISKVSVRHKPQDNQWQEEYQTGLDDFFTWHIDEVPPMHGNYADAVCTSCGTYFEYGYPKPTWIDETKCPNCGGKLVICHPYPFNFEEDDDENSPIYLESSWNPSADEFVQTLLDEAFNNGASDENAVMDYIVKSLSEEMGLSQEQASEIASRHYDEFRNKMIEPNIYQDEPWIEGNPHSATDFWMEDQFRENGVPNNSALSKVSHIVQLVPATDQIMSYGDSMVPLQSSWNTKAYNALDNGEVVGSILIDELHDSIWVTWIYVKNELRNTDIFQQLLEPAIDLSKSTGLPLGGDAINPRIYRILEKRRNRLSDVADTDSASRYIHIETEDLNKRTENSFPYRKDHELCQNCQKNKAGLTGYCAECNEARKEFIISKIADWDEGEEPEEGPDEYDAFIADIRGGYSISLEGKYLGSYSERDYAIKALLLAMDKAGYYPNVWYQNERGDCDEIDLQKELDDIKPLYSVGEIVHDYYTQDLSNSEDNIPATILEVTRNENYDYVYTLKYDDGTTDTIPEEYIEPFNETGTQILEREGEPTGELWPDTLPWGEAEQDYYRNARLAMIKIGEIPSIMYHATKRELWASIQQEGLKIGKEHNFTLINNLYDHIYGENRPWPIFLSVNPGKSNDTTYVGENAGPDEFIVLAINVEGLPLEPDMPGLYDSGAYIEEDSIYYEDGNTPIVFLDAPMPEGYWKDDEEESQDIDLEWLFTPEGTAAAIQVTGTAACSVDIPAERISLYSRISKVADISQNDISDANTYTTDLHTFTDDTLPDLRNRDHDNIEEIKQFADDNNNVHFVYLGGKIYWGRSTDDIISRNLLHNLTTFSQAVLAGTINLDEGYVIFDEESELNQTPELKKSFMFCLKKELNTYTPDIYYPNDDVLHSDEEIYDVKMGSITKTASVSFWLVDQNGMPLENFPEFDEWAIDNYNIYVDNSIGGFNNWPDDVWDLYQKYEEARQDSQHEVNLANSNAHALFEWLQLSIPSTTTEMLGISIHIPDSGSFDPSMLKQAIELALQSEQSDEGTRDKLHMEPGQAQVFEMGRRPGYFNEVSQRLIALCDIAISKNGVIAYG